MTEEIYYHQISFVCVLLETQKRKEGESKTEQIPLKQYAFQTVYCSTEEGIDNPKV